MAEVDKRKRIDVFITFHGGQKLKYLQVPFHVTYPTVRDFATLVADRLRRIDQRRPSIFLDSEQLSSHIDDLFNAILQLRGGGIALVLLTRDYLRSPYCLAELRAFLHLNSLRSNFRMSDEAISIKVVSLEPDVHTPQGVKTGVDIVLADVRRMEHEPALKPFVQGLKHLVFNKIDHQSTDEDAADQVCASVMKDLQSELTDSCLGESKHLSFIDMCRFFVDADVDSLSEELELNVSENTYIVRLMLKARKNGVASYENVDRLLDAAQKCRCSDACVAAVGGYKRKWCSKRWSWTAAHRNNLNGFLEEGREALQSLQTAIPTVPPDLTLTALAEKYPVLRILPGYKLLSHYGDFTDFPTWLGNTKLTIVSACDQWASVRIEPNIFGAPITDEVHNVGGSQPENIVTASITRKWFG